MHMLHRLLGLYVVGVAALVAVSLLGHTDLVRRRRQRTLGAGRLAASGRHHHRAGS